MRTHVAALLLALMAAPAVRADTQFRRPLNGDCISLAGSSAVSLYPEQFMLQGEEHVKVQFYTQASAPKRRGDANHQVCAAAACCRPCGRA